MSQIAMAQASNHMDVLLFASISALFYIFQQIQDAEGRGLDANELICMVTPENRVLPSGGRRARMRRQNLWHRATYVAIRHEPEHLEQHGNHPSDVFLLVQKRSNRKDYCPGRFDATPGGVVAFGESYIQNAKREIEEEMGIKLDDSLERLFTFSFEDDRVRVWGEFFEYTYRGALKDLCIQTQEVESIERMSLQDIMERMESEPDQFMPDSLYAIKLYLQRRLDMSVNRRLLKGYSSSDLDSYDLRPKPSAIFFDCDDCLYFDGWKTANLLTEKIEQWCLNRGLRPGQAYEMYKEYGTALRGLLAEGYLEDTEESVNRFLAEVHDIPIKELLPRDDNLRRVLLRMDPSIPKFIFTASVRDHTLRCLQALGLDEGLFVDIIDCKSCKLETKHSRFSFEIAMKVAG